MKKLLMLVLCLNLLFSSCVGAVAPNTPEPVIKNGFWEGTWPGVSFMVKAGELSDFRGQLYFSDALYPLPYCNIYTYRDQVVAITGKQFRFTYEYASDHTVATVTGTFVSPTRAEGTYVIESCQRTKTIPPHQGTWFAVWRRDAR